MRIVSASEFDAIMDARRSVRAFLSRAVPPDTIDAALAIAGKAPSNCNIQPWVVHIASGDALARLRTAFGEAADAGQYAPDVPRTGVYEGLYRERRNASARALFEATGVARHDMEARQRSLLRNFTMFDAPHAAFLFLPEPFGLREAADLGMFAQSFMLALTARGLGSCAQGALSHNGPLLRELLGVGPELRCLFGISFGYADPEHPSVNAITDRAALTEFVHFHD